MQPINPAQFLSRSNADNVPLEQLAKNSALSDEQKIGAVSRQFEALLLRQFLTEAHKPLFRDSAGALSGASKDIYQDLMVSSLADAISKSGTFGLSRYFQAQMTTRPDSPSPDPSSLPANES